ncbi:CHAT domain-containing protein [Actinoplanes xinjiangensis]|uniref:CHAT domain-containing protein n=1 Tax=Actinoplanes xinjiangensis TaxID=512350 RepID=A0A316EQR0_9ACTN|nr:CHAT domain-containing protein [Actinoplanes xinjiangensis]PWK33234.1 CHAT domain-containing protein [Actinoplanes xinjiangensis]GIF43527.1 hypothetical protein Axi01nite_78380 [Actinoplanes xinjiangensis]
MLVIRIHDAAADTYVHRVELLTGEGEELAAGTLDTELPPFADDPYGDAGRLVRESVLGAYAPGSGRVERVGAYLSDLLLKAGVGAAWHDARIGAPDMLTVLDIRSPRFGRLPWELLTDDGVQVRNLVRGCLPFGEARAAEPTPMRVLIVVGSNDPNLSAETEVAAVQRALADRPWQVHTEVLVHPSRNEFYDRVDQLQPHVLHFIGHATLSPGTDSPVLDFTDALNDDERWSLSAAHIRNGMLNCVPRVLVLNACRTAEISDQDGVWGIADAALGVGMSAVVCMQGLVDSHVAIQFSDVFYRSVSAGHRVDQAVAKARFEISRRVGLEKRDWGLPVLHLGTHPGQVLSMDCPLTPSDRQQLLQVPEFVEARKHVDRDVQRRHMWWSGGRPDGSATGLVTVTGATETGRTHLVFSALLTCAGQGHQVRYVDLASARRRSWIEVFYAIRDGTPTANVDSALREPLPAHAFADFDREVSRLAEGREPRPEDPRPGAPPRPHFSATTEHAPVYEKRIAARFTEALGRVAGDRPLTIAIDNLGGGHGGGMVPEQITSHLSPLLLRAAARAELGPVRLILVLREEERELLTADVRGAMHEVPVHGFPRRLFPFLQREHFARAGHHDDEWQRLEGLIKWAHSDNIGEHWLPDWFDIVDRARQAGAR